MVTTVLPLPIFSATSLAATTFRVSDNRQDTQALKLKNSAIPVQGSLTQSDESPEEHMRDRTQPLLAP
ncbi:hypothetical protein N7486_006005 [Penicillium sp. IBT 16267x]|nr:hypothetical protein N7486_006005 [Penicillium sp. IBT 16267x]